MVFLGVIIPLIRFCVATIGVCAFCASASVGAFFILKEVSL